MRRVVGTITRSRCGAWWQISADPDIMIRVKRAIPGVKTSRAAVLLVSDTDGNASELEWLLHRWTFDMTSMEADRLIEPESHRDPVESVTPPDRIKRLAASVLEHAAA